MRRARKGMSSSSNGRATLTLDGEVVAFESGQSLYEVAREHGATAHDEQNPEQEGQ